MFYDRIRKIDFAAKFNKSTFEGNRKDMGKEALRTWMRKVLKGIVKPEFFIMISANLSELPDTEENRANFGKTIDETLRLIEDKNTNMQNGHSIDEIFTRYLPSLFR